MPRQLLIHSPENGLPLEVPHQDLVEMCLLVIHGVRGHIRIALSHRSGYTYFKTNYILTVPTSFVYENITTEYSNSVAIIREENTITKILRLCLLESLVFLKVACPGLEKWPSRKGLEE